MGVSPGRAAAACCSSDPQSLGGNTKSVPEKGRGCVLERAHTDSLCLEGCIYLSIFVSVLGERFSRIFISFPGVFLIC